MEYVALILVFILFIAFVLGKEIIEAKNAEKRFKKSLYEKYGEPFDKEISLERFAHICGYYKRHISERQIDDITWNDLNMDVIFMRMNDTFSSAGEEYLYYTLRNNTKSTAELNKLEEVISFFEKHPDERVAIQMLMRKLGTTGKFSLYDYLDNLELLGKRSNRKHILLNLLYIPFIVLTPFQLPAGLCGLAILMSYNIATYFKEKNEIEAYFISFVYIIRLLNVCEEVLKVDLPACEAQWSDMKQSLIKVLGIRKGSSIVFKGASSLSTGNPADIIMDYIRMTMHIDIILFNRMLGKLRSHVEDIDSLITNIGYVETAIAIGNFRHSLKEGWCVPEFVENSFTNDEILVIKDGYHPLIDNPVKNSIATDKGVLLTGSNASGKSTFLRMAAVNAILAQTIHTCMADEYKAPLFSICSSMSLKDNLESGESYYIVEIKSLKRILQSAETENRRVLCFVDEVLRGTNTVERIAASTQILKSLATDEYLCFAATHDIELTQLLIDRYNNYHFEEEIVDGDILFPYKLMEGKATTRNAIKLLQIMGYEDTIIEDATRLAEHFVTFGTW